MVIHIHEDHPMVEENGINRTTKCHQWQQNLCSIRTMTLKAFALTVAEILGHQQHANYEWKQWPKRIPTFTKCYNLRLSVVMNTHTPPPVLTLALQKMSPSPVRLRRCHHIPDWHRAGTGCFGPKNYRSLRDLMMDVGKNGSKCIPMVNSDATIKTCPTQKENERHSAI